jgi:hypothetical protein
VHAAWFCESTNLLKSHKALRDPTACNLWEIQFCLVLWVDILMNINYITQKPICIRWYKTEIKTSDDTNTYSPIH